MKDNHWKMKSNKSKAIIIARKQLSELVCSCEKTLALLNNPAITGKETRYTVIPKNLHPFPWV